MEDQHVPRTLILIAVALASLVAGLGAFTFTHAKGWSYLSKDPKSCINCHVMNPQWDSWQHSSHKNVADCITCHMPHTFVNKWYTKALNGWNHGKAFTTGNIPEPMVITKRNKEIVLENCVECHKTTVSTMHVSMSRKHEADEPTCTTCHGNVGHQGNK